MNAAHLRRVIHVGSALLLIIPAAISWPVLRVGLAAGTPLVLGLDWLRRRQPGVATFLGRVAPVFRPAERARISGAAWLWIGYALAAWCPPVAAQGGILAGALADPAASLVGGRWGAGARKSWVGTGAACAVAAVAVLIAGTPWPGAAAAGLVAGALERWSGPLDDNLTIAPGVAVFLWLVS